MNIMKQRNRIVLFLFIIICYKTVNSSPTFIQLMQTQARCPRYEYMKTCGRICERTCENINGTEPCPRICLPTNCSCINGYVRDPFGNCVLPEDCPENCTIPGEIFSTCGFEQTCFDGDSDDDLNFDYASPEETSSEDCNVGCFCGDGLSRHPNGSCVERNECPICDWKTEVYETCGTSCPNTCGNFNDTHRPPCPALCVPGCFCKKGLVLDDTGKCILPEQCPNLICKRAHEVYDPCGTACPDTCRNMRTKRKCIDKCVEGCFCAEGYVRADSGECVLLFDCPLEEICTAPNENYTKCGSQNEQTCDNFWTYTSTDGCEEACECEKEFVRNQNGFCVKPEECPDLCPNPGEEYLSCGPMVEATCHNTNNTLNLTGCGKAGCYCTNGLVRHQNGRCVQPSNCPVCNWDQQIYNVCGSACPDNCYNYLEKNRFCNLFCAEGCFCKDGLVLDNSGYCISPENCPNNTCNRSRKNLLIEKLT